MSNSNRNSSNTEASTDDHESQDSFGRTSDVRGRLHTNDYQRQHFFNQIQMCLRLDPIEEVTKKQLGLMLTRSDSFKGLVTDLMKQSNRTESDVLAYLVRVRKNVIENFKEKGDSGTTGYLTY